MLSAETEGSEGDNTYRDLDNSGYDKKPNSIIVLLYADLSKGNIILKAVLKDAILQYSDNSLFSGSVVFFFLRNS